MFRSWRETVVRVEGGITEMLEKYFDDFWEHVQSGIPWMPLSGKPYGEFQFLYGIPIPRRRHLYYKLINSIEAAKKQIYLVTPYFVPNLRLLQVLRQSAKRGVEIKLIVSKRTDHPWIDRAAHFYFKPLINAGIKVYQYETRTIHVKMAACDNTVGFIGSQNLDNLSLFFNHEGSLVSTNPEFITQIQKQFTDDLGSCREIKLPEWDHRPMLDRLIELSTLPFHWWM
jgi:cardiolipin synthase